jgi:hypothetical protein
MLLVLRYLENEHVREPQWDALRWGMTCPLSPHPPQPPAATFNAERLSGAMKLHCAAAERSRFNCIQRFLYILILDFPQQHDSKARCQRVPRRSLRAAFQIQGV